jgi:hypothetical protein
MAWSNLKEEKIKIISEDHDGFLFFVYKIIMKINFSEDDDGLTPLFIACIQGDMDIANQLTTERLRAELLRCLSD